MRKLRIGVISTENQGVGGAVRATRRLVEGLKLRGHDAHLISLDARSAVDGIGVTPAPPRNSGEHLALNANENLQRTYIDPRRTPLSNTFFSAQVAGYSLAGHAILEQFDIFNLHWIANFLAPHTLAELVASGRPVIHTLHDMAAFTGGCHYSAGCQRYREQCSPCPQLQDDVLELTRWTLEQKRRCVTADNVAVIAPSRWLAGCASESGLFPAERVFTIPNALDTDVFRPTETSVAKQLLGIDPGVKTLLFGAENNRERRKGFDLLIDAWKRIADEPQIKDLLIQQRIRILVFGAGTEALEAAGVPLLNLGTVLNDSRLALIYSAADLLILSSREDNLPNILLEAMACATPVVAFAVGGIPDVIEDRGDGRLVQPFDVAEMSRAIVELLTREEAAAGMGSAARRKIAEHHPLDSQAAVYEEIFVRMLEEPQAQRPSPTPRSASLPATIDLPVTLNPEAASHPIGLYLEQCEQIGRWERRNSESAHQIERVNDVLVTAIGEILASSSWRHTRILRGIDHDPAVSAATTPEQNAVVLLNLLRSKSWELTGPLRLLSRAMHGIPRLLKRFRLPRPARQQAISPVEPLPPFTFALGALGDAPKQPSPNDQRALNIICLHLFHLDLWDEFRVALKPLIGTDTPLYCTLPESSAHFIPNIYRELGEQHCKVFVLENRGLDIYPFLFIFDQLLTRGITPLTLTKLHTKKSTHHSPEFAEDWRKDLYRGLLSQYPALVNRFHDKALAMICSQKWWVHEDETSENFQAERRAIESACRLFGVSRTEHYLSGSMYIVSFDYLKKLFSGIDRDALLSQFQPGYQRSDTLGHGFERVICYGVEKFALKVGLL